MPDALADQASRWDDAEPHPVLDEAYVCNLHGQHDEHAAYVADRYTAGALWLTWTTPDSVRLIPHPHCPPVRLGVERCTLYKGHPGECT